MLRMSAAIFAAAALASGCAATSDGATPADVDLARSQIDSMWSGLTRAMTAGDTAALAAFYTDSAYFAETGTPTLRGRAAILSAAASVFACCRYLESRSQLELTELAGERALQFGTYREVLQPAGQAPLAMYGRFEAVLERDTAGASNAWRIGRLVVIRDSAVAATSVTR